MVDYVKVAGPVLGGLADIKTAWPTREAYKPKVPKRRTMVKPPMQGHRTDIPITPDMSYEEMAREVHLRWLCRRN